MKKRESEKEKTASGRTKYLSHVRQIGCYKYRTFSGRLGFRLHRYPKVLAAGAEAAIWIGVYIYLFQSQPRKITASAKVHQNGFSQHNRVSPARNVSAALQAVHTRFLCQFRICPAVMIITRGSFNTGSQTIFRWSVNGLKCYCTTVMLATTPCFKKRFAFDIWACFAERLHLKSQSLISVQFKEQV